MSSCSLLHSAGSQGSGELCDFLRSLVREKFWNSPSPNPMACSKHWNGASCPVHSPQPEASFFSCFYTILGEWPCQWSWVPCQSTWCLYPAEIHTSDGQWRDRADVQRLACPCPPPQMWLNPAFRCFAHSVISTPQIKNANKKSIWHYPFLLVRSVSNWGKVPIHLHCSSNMQMNIEMHFLRYFLQMPNQQLLKDG